MFLLSSVLFAISASLDAFVVGISYGIKRVKFTFLQNIGISLITLAGTVLSITAGHALLPLLPEKIAEVVGGIMLSILGIYYIAKFMKGRIKKCLSDKHPVIVDLREASSESKWQPASLSFRETVFLGLALSINNMGIGIGASIAGLDLFSAAAITIVLSISFLFFGNYMGRIKLLRVAEQYADLISGLLLVILGVFI